MNVPTGGTADSFDGPAVAFDGSIVTYTDSGNLYRWTRNGGPALLASAPDPNSFSGRFVNTTISADGSVIYTNTTAHLYRWTAGEGLTEVASPPTGMGIRHLTDASGNGHSLVGRLFSWR